MEEWLERLVSMGYTRQSMVTAPGEFALRGGILDLYPLNLEDPVRIELFDTDVDSIRTFSAEDQRSTGKLKDVSILPAAEFVWKAEDLMIIAEKLEHALGVSLKKMNDAEAKERLTINMKGDIALMREGSTPENMLKYASFSAGTTSLESYFPSNGIVLFDEIGRVLEVVASLESDEKEWMVALLEEGKIVHDAKTSYSFEEVHGALKQRKVYLSLFVRSVPGIVVKKTVTFSCKPMQQFHGQMSLLKNEIERWHQGRFNIFIIADGNERMQKVQSILEDYDMQSALSGKPSAAGGIIVIDGDLSAGLRASVSTNGGYNGF